MRMPDHLSIQCEDFDRAAASEDAVLVSAVGSRILDFGAVIRDGTDVPRFWIGPLTTGEPSCGVRGAFITPGGSRRVRVDRDRPGMTC